MFSLGSNGSDDESLRCAVIYVSSDLLIARCCSTPIPIFLALLVYRRDGYTTICCYCTSQDRNTIHARLAQICSNSG